MEMKERQDVSVDGDVAVEEAYNTIIHYINRMGGGGKDLLPFLVLREHPTLTGQLGKQIALGVVRAVMRDEMYKGGWPTEGSYHPCDIYSALPSHPVHDGRWSCNFVCGAFNMSLQYFV
jgi:hypothetical protein